MKEKLFEDEACYINWWDPRNPVRFEAGDFTIHAAHVEQSDLPPKFEEDEVEELMDFCNLVEDFLDGDEAEATLRGRIKDSREKFFEEEDE